MIFNTFNNDAEKWTSKIGMFGKSFDELRNSVNNSFKEIIDNIDNFDKDVSFWESLKNNLAPKDDSGKSFIRNSLGEIISQDNIDSYIKELDISSAKDIQKEILSIAEDVNAGNITWDDYFEIQEKTNNKYINETIKNTKDLSKLTAGDLVQANQKARSNVIAHNNALNQQTLSAKASKLALQGLALAGNMLVSMGISLVVSKAIEYFTELANTVNNTREAAEGFSSSISEYNSNLSKNQSSLNDLNSRYKELSKGVGTFGQNLTLSASEYEEYKNIISQVSDIMPDLALRYNEQGEKIGFVKDKLYDLNEEYKKYQQNEALEFVINGDESGNTIQNVLDDYNLNNDGNLGVVSGGTTWGQWIANAVKEFFTFGYADTFDTTYTADYIKRVLEQVRDTENRDDATKLLKTFTGDMDADEERKNFGKSMSEIKDLNDEDFKKWQENLDGYIQKYESQILDANNRVRESMGVMAKSLDEYWNVDVSDDERTAVSSFISNMTGDMIKTFEDENGKISQGALSNYITTLIQSFSTDQELFNAYSSLMSEGFKNMPYEKASQSLNKWVSQLATKTGFDKNQIAEMFGLDGYANYLIHSDPTVVDYDIKDKLEQTFVDESGKTIDAHKEVDNMTFDELLRAYEVMQTLGEEEKITLGELSQQMAQMEDDTSDLSISLDNLKTSSDSLKSLSNVFNQLSNDGYMSLDSLSAIKEIVGDSIPNWDKFQQKLLNMKAGTDEYNQMLSELTYTTMESKLGIEKLANADESYIATVLRENGVLNANEVAHDAVERAKAKEMIQTELARDASDINMGALLTEANACDITADAFVSLVAQEIVINSNNLSVSEKITALQQLQQQAKLTGAQYSSLTALLDTPYEADSATQEAWAKKHGFTVSAKLNADGAKKRVTNSKGEKVEDWIWEKDGVTYENVNEAALSLA